MIVTFRPLQAWPHPETEDRKPRYTFRAGWADTLHLLRREIERLDGANVLIGAFFRDQDIRLDGYPRADAREPEHPGIEISFDSRHGRLVYATDAYAGWEANARAIALGLEALRAVDRYGVTRRGEQYAGWRALTAGPPGVTTEAEAWEVLEEVLGHTVPKPARKDRPFVRDLWRRAVKATHPDHGGDPDAFRRVQAARQLLEDRA